MVQWETDPGFCFMTIPQFLYFFVYVDHFTHRSTKNTTFKSFIKFILVLFMRMLIFQRKWRALFFPPNTEGHRCAAYGVSQTHRKGAFRKRRKILRNDQQKDTKKYAEMTQ